MSTVFPDVDASPVAGVGLLEQPAAALAAIATAASAGVSLLPFKVRILSFDWIIRLPGLEKCLSAIRDQMRIARGPANTEAKGARVRLRKCMSLSSPLSQPYSSGDRRWNTQHGRKSSACSRC